MLWNIQTNNNKKSVKVNIDNVFSADNFDDLSHSVEFVESKKYISYDYISQNNTIMVDVKKDDKYNLKLQRPITVYNTRSISCDLDEYHLQYNTAFNKVVDLEIKFLNANLVSEFQLTRSKNIQSSLQVVSPIAGRVVDIKIKKDQVVTKDQCLLIIEAMKMENKIFATASGKITALNVKKFDSIAVGKIICEIHSS